MLIVKAISIPKGAIMSLKLAEVQEVVTLISIPKGAIMRI